MDSRRKIELEEIKTKSFVLSSLPLKLFLGSSKAHFVKERRPISKDSRKISFCFDLFSEGSKYESLKNSKTRWEKIWNSLRWIEFYFNKMEFRIVQLKYWKWDEFCLGFFLLPQNEYLSFIIQEKNKISKRKNYFLPKVFLNENSFITFSIQRRKKINNYSEIPSPFQNLKEQT